MDNAATLSLHLRPKQWHPRKNGANSPYFYPKQGNLLSTCLTSGRAFTQKSIFAANGTIETTQSTRFGYKLLRTASC